MTRFFTLLFIIASLPLLGQEDKPGSRVKLFMDCSTVWCDMTYIRTEINIVDFVVDRLAADVHVLVTSQRLGSGGNKYQMIFYGQNKFSRYRDTLRFTMLPMATDVEVRDKLVTYLKFGLVPYITKTDLIAQVKIDMKRPADSMKNDKVSQKDKWNFWVFRIGGNGNMEADQNYLSTRINANTSAVRTTDETRLEFRFSTGRNRSVFKFVDDNGIEESVTVKNRNYRVNHSLVKSISDHWSYGYFLFYQNNTFSNYQSSTRLIPGVEYNIYPYSEVNTRYLAFSYGLDLIYNNYYEETLFDKMKEGLAGHMARIVYSYNQKWGSVSGNITYTNFFHNWSMFSLEVNSRAEVRLTGNLSFYVFAFGGLTRNQVFIPKGGATVEDVLSRRRQLLSGYNFGTFFGINYRFGSILNNFVNPRMNDDI